jgi:hypothetical protein
MSNSTLIHLTLKTRVQAPELAFYGVKIVGGDQRPYSQTVEQNILFYRLQIRALISATCALTRKKRVLGMQNSSFNLKSK